VNGSLTPDGLRVLEAILADAYEIAD